VSGVAVVAHRGASGDFPENTAVAFEEAIRLEVDAIELDVHLTADGELLVIHDPTVDRNSDGTGAVADLSMAQITELDAGSWFDAKFAGARYLTLEGALDLMPSAMVLNVHVKAGDKDREVVVAKTVAQLVRAGLLGTAFVASDDASLAVARGAEPGLRICNLSTQPAETYVERSSAIGCLILQPGNGRTDADLVRRAHENGMTVNPFYADDEGEMRRLIGCGVDGILTNYPQRLQVLLAGLGRAIDRSRPCNCIECS
jgi:glycerophosphoryl diester phosphodiesterase